MTITPDVGFLGNLTPDQEVKLRQSWAHLLRLCGNDSVTDKVPDESAELLQHLSDRSLDNFRVNFWRFVLGDHPDAVVLRFLRARKWDVRQAMVMLVSALNWREEIGIDETIIRDGESVILKDSPSKKDQEFMMQYRSGKAYTRGLDRQDRPVFVVKVRLHDPTKQSPEAMERFILHSIESLKLMVRDPRDRACLLFDLTGFGLANMDFHVVKYLAQVFEARYPETLGAILVHNAPFVFWGVWTIIKPWLDPAIASKVHFTKGNSGLAKFISQDGLQREYGGQDHWKYQYIEPVPGENARLEMREKRMEIEKDRNELALQFEALTCEWLAAKLTADAPVDKEQEAKRNALVKNLQANYWELDPYVRATTYYHRAGIVDKYGMTDFTVN